MAGNDQMTLPAYVDKLVAAFKHELPDADVEYEQVRRDRYRFIVISRQFDGMGHPERQELVWQLTERTLNAQELLKVTMILTIGEQEMAPQA